MFPAGKLSMIHGMIFKELQYRDDYAYHGANESKQQASVLQKKKKTTEEVCCEIQAGCTTLEAKIDQFSGDLLELLASAAPTT